MNIKNIIEILGIEENTSVNDILDSLIIYLRKSRKDSDYYKDEPIEKTLQRHEKELQDYIISIFGKPIPEYNIFREVASGDTIDDRPVIQEVLSLIEDSKYKAVICIEIERLARGNTMDQGIIAQTFQLTETKIITPMKIYNLDNEDDLSYFEDGLYQARKYLKYTKKILNRGRIRSVKDGKYIGSETPFGYDKMKLINEKGYVLIENKEEANVVRLIADLFLNGLHTNYIVKNNDTISSVAKLFGQKKKDIINNNLDLKVGEHINITIDSKYTDYIIKENDTIEKIKSTFNISELDIHIPNDFFKPQETLKIDVYDMRCTNIGHYLNYLKFKPRKGEFWNSNMVRNILTGYAIYGYLTWDRRKTVKILKDGEVKKTSPNNKDFIIAKGKHTAILSEDIREKIQEKFKKNRRKTVPEDKEIKNPLVGLVRCGYCNTLMTRRPYTPRVGTTAVYKRKYYIDKEKLRVFLYEAKGNKSLSEISQLTNINKTKLSHYFTNSVKRFAIPKTDVWVKLKEVLNIKDNKFDKYITEYEKITIIHEDTLICRKLRCPCVSSDLVLIESAVLEQLKIILKDYKTYVSDYVKVVEKEIKDNNALINSIEDNIKKHKEQIEKACELVETGTYTQDLFIERTTKLNKEINDLIKQKEELNRTSITTEKYNRRIKSIPLIENVLNNYNTSLSAEEKNKLLSSIIKEIIYKKDKGGRYLKNNFSLKITLLFD